MCRFAHPAHPLYEGADAPNAVKVCDGAGNMLACQLCPQSLTYWRLTADEPSTHPYDGRGESTLTAKTPPDVSHLIDCKIPVEFKTPSGETVKRTWSTVPPHQAKPCVLCLKDATMRSPKGTPIHKVCAEEWAAGKRTFASPR